MRRPICIISFTYIIGVLIEYYIGFSKSVLLLCFSLSILLLIYSLIKNKDFFGCSLMIILLFIGALNFYVNNEQQGNLNSFYGQEVQLIGVVREASYKSSLQITLGIEQVISRGYRYSVNDTVISKLNGEYYPPQEFLGKRVSIVGELVKPEKNRNPKMFNYRLYLKSKNIYSILYSSIDSIKVLEEKSSLSPLYIANKIRYNIIKKVLELLPQKEGRVLLGMLLGDKNELDEDIYQGFREVGIAHILAVSGLHVGIIYLFLNKLLKHFSAPLKLGVFLSILSIYVVITGYVPSILRATFMIMLIILAPLINKKYDSLSAIAFVAFILLIYNPIMLFSTGFQLSFGAVLSIALLYKPILKKLSFLPSNWSQLIAASVAAQVGILPLTAYYFNMISPWSIIINIPIVIILGYLLPFGIATLIISSFSTFLSHYMAGILLIGIRIMIGIAGFGKTLPFSGYRVISPSIIFFIAYYAILFVISYKGKRLKLNKKKNIIIIMSIYFVVSTLISLIPGTFEITFLDVGQGDCIIVRTPKNKVLLIDSGGNNYGSYDVGENIVVPYLLRHGIKKIDLILPSHFHFDHVGGLYKVLEDLDVYGMLVGKQVEENEDYLNLMSICKDKGIDLYRIERGSVIKLEKDVELYIKNPSELIQGSRDDANNNSVVALLKYDNISTLFTGDIETQAENEILNLFPDLKADIIKIPHHGSRFSNTDKFLKQIAPKVAVIQVGRNVFGHPSNEVLEKLNKIDADVFRNDQNGAIIITVDKEKIKIKTTL